MDETITIIASAIVSGAGIITAIFEKVKTIKKNKIIAKAKILQKLPTIIKDCETIAGNGNGTIKKQLALNQIQIECNTAGIHYNENEWSIEIEKILETPQKKLNNKGENE